MVFFCQQHCFAKHYKTKVLSCKKAKLQQQPTAIEGQQKAGGGGKKQKPQQLDCYEVLFEDTVLFPEGGGQPDDHGVVQLITCDKCEDQNVPIAAENNTANDIGDLSLQDETSSATKGKQAQLLLTEDGVDHSPLRSGGGCKSCTCKVLRVVRKGSDAVHYLDNSLDVGADVLQVVDWVRRKDHMQQHSGQHLITAIAEKLYGFPTTSWSLGQTTSFIELQTSNITTDQKQRLEEAVNSAIAAAVAVTVDEYAVDDPALDESIRSRGLPADHVGRVRVVTIAGVDANMCCGTHVSNTAQLQAIKLIKSEPGKQGKTLLTFVAGDRLLRYLSECQARQDGLHSILNTNPDNFVSIVQKTQASLKIADKTAKEALRDLADAQAQLFNLSSCQASEGESQSSEGVNSFVSGSGQPKSGKQTRVWYHHRRLADLDYLNALVANCDDESVLKILTAGEDKGPGILLVHGPPELVAAIAPKVCSVLEGKGGGKSRFTAKVTALHRRDQAYDIVKEHLKQF